jgi:hypothetical protein
MVPQQEDDTPHWSKGDLVKVRSKTADNWRHAYVLMQRGHNLLLVIPEAEPGRSRRFIAPFGFSGIAVHAPKR